MDAGFDFLETSENINIFLKIFQKKNLFKKKNLIIFLIRMKKNDYNFN